MAKNNVLILIPARFDSTRFPGKPLAKILGKPMIQWVYERSSNSYSDENNVSAYVVTDNLEIKSIVDDFGGNSCLISDETDSGTERIALAVSRHFKEDQFDLIINVQGDEPLITSEVVERLIDFHSKNNFDIATVVKKEAAIGNDPNRVKAVYCPSSGSCLYFSRANIPHDRDNIGTEFYAHIGIYSFKPEALQKFCSFDKGFYEKMESLEQLRALENGQTIGAIEVDVNLQGVDTPEDISKVEDKLNG